LQTGDARHEYGVYGNVGRRSPTWHECGSDARVEPESHAHLFPGRNGRDRFDSLTEGALEFVVPGEITERPMLRQGGLEVGLRERR
jgi:hypothetical protein